MIAITLSVFVVLYVGLHAVLYQLKGGDETTLQAGGTIFAHICGFAGMYGFADSQEVELLGTYGIVVAIVVASIFILGLSLIMRTVMAKVEARDILNSNGDASQVEEEDEKWVETSEEAE